MITDKDRIDFLEVTTHVLCFDKGNWFCAWRGEDGFGWTDREDDDTVRGAIDSAMKEVNWE